MRIAVLGASGFIGSHLANRMLQDGHQVVGFSRTHPTWLEERFCGRQYRSVVGDFRDEGGVAEAVDGADVCFHLISTTTPATAEADAARDAVENLLPSTKLAERLARSGSTRLIFISSGGTVYGNAEIVPTPETAPLAPVSIYGLTKSAIETYISGISRRYGAGFVSVRPSNVYGIPLHGTPFGLIPTILRRIADGLPIEIWGDGLNVRDYVYVDDLIDALALIASSRQDLGTLNIGSGIGHTIMDVIGLLEQESGLKAEVVHKPARPLDVRLSVLDTSRARQLLDWTPRISFERGTRQVVASQFAR